MSINNMNVSGNLTKDAELRYTPTGYSILTMRVVFDQPYRTAEGKWDTKPGYFDAVMGGKRGEKLAAYLTKGTKVSLAGKLHYGQWTTKDGKTASALDMKVEELEFMSRAKDGSTKPVQVTADPDPLEAVQQAYPDAVIEQYSTEDIPF